MDTKVAVEPSRKTRRGRWWRWPLYLLVGLPVAYVGIIFLIVAATPTKQSEPTGAAVTAEPKQPSPTDAQPGPVPPAAEQRVVAPKQTLLIKQSADPRLRDGMSGEHAMSVARLDRDAFNTVWPLKAKTITVGCVPCLGPLSYLAVFDGRAYASSGLSMSRASRMQARSAGQSMDVTDDFDPMTYAPGKDRGHVYDFILRETEKVPGCSTAAYLEDFAKIGAAAAGRLCLSTYKP